MTISDGLLIGATFAGPVVAVQLQKYLERLRTAKQGKDYVFRTLMGTRATRLSAEHVRALNMIDVEYSKGGSGESRVRTAWKAYLDHLNTTFSPEGGVTWGVKQVDLFVDMLFAMAEVLGYPFDKTDIKNSIYIPKAHGTIEEQELAIRSGLVSLLTNKTALHVSGVPATEADATTQNEVRGLVFEYLSGKRAWPVVIRQSDGDDEAK